MGNSADQLIYQAVMLLEDEGDLDGAITALDDAIGLAGIAGFKLQELRARLLLGEVLLQLERHEEAREHFAKVVILAANFESEGESVDVELRTASQLLELCVDRTDPKQLPEN